MSREEIQVMSKFGEAQILLKKNVYINLQDVLKILLSCFSWKIIYKLI